MKHISIILDDINKSDDSQVMESIIVTKCPYYISLNDVNLDKHLVSFDKSWSRHGTTVEPLFTKHLSKALFFSSMEDASRVKNLIEKNTGESLIIRTLRKGGD